MHPGTLEFNASQPDGYREICDLLAREIGRGLPDADNRIWHAHPVWFLDANPVVGYSKLKSGIRLFFWSGAGFDEDALHPGTGKFKDAWIVYRNVVEVDSVAVRRWLDKARRIQWNYRDLRKNGRLVRIGP